MKKERDRESKSHKKEKNSNAKSEKKEDYSKAKLKKKEKGGESKTKPEAKKEESKSNATKEVIFESKLKFFKENKKTHSSSKPPTFSKNDDHSGEYLEGLLGADSSQSEGMSHSSDEDEFEERQAKKPKQSSGEIKTKNFEDRHIKDEQPKLIEDEKAVPTKSCGVSKPSPGNGIIKIGLTTKPKKIDSKKSIKDKGSKPNVSNFDEPIMKLRRVGRPSKANLKKGATSALPYLATLESTDSSHMDFLQLSKEGKSCHVGCCPEPKPLAPPFQYLKPNPLGTTSDLRSESAAWNPQRGVIDNMQQFLAPDTQGACTYPISQSRTKHYWGRELTNPLHNEIFKDISSIDACDLDPDPNLIQEIHRAAQDFQYHDRLSQNRKNPRQAQLTLPTLVAYGALIEELIKHKIANMK